MPILEIQGIGKVEVGDEFLSLSPEHQQTTVNEIAAHATKTAAPRAGGYINTLSQMATEGSEQFSKGKDQLISAFRNAPKAARDEAQQKENVGNITAGFGNTVVGGLNTVASPINAALRTYIGEPVEKATGIPKEITELAASFAIPSRMPAAILGRADKAAEAVPTVAALKDAARAGYESEAVKGLAIQPKTLRDWSTVTKSALDEAGLVDELAKGTHAILKRAGALAPDGAVVTGVNIDSLRKALGSAAKSNDSTERAAAVKAMDALDDMLPGIKQADVISGNPQAAAKTLEDARGNYSAAKHAELIDKKVYRAEQRAAAANSGMNQANTMRGRVADVLVSDRERRGFSPEAITAMEKFVQGSRAENALRTAGNVMGGGGGLLAAGYGVAGAVSSQGALAATPIIGFGLKKLSNALATRDVGKINEIVRSDSPLGKQMAGPLADWSKAAVRVEHDMNARNLTMLSISSRNLSNNLKDAGIEVTPNQLVKSAFETLSAPAPSE